MAKKKIKVNLFDDLRAALSDAKAYEQGQAVDLHVIELPPPPQKLSAADIREIRESLNASQKQFAVLLNVSTNAVESWEQGVRQPQNATLKLLDIAFKNPQVLLLGATSKRNLPRSQARRHR